MIKAFVKKLPGVSWLREGWPDEARYLIQSAALRSVLGDNELAGDCLNAGCGEGLYAQFLDSFPKIRRIAHMDLDKPNLACRFPGGRHEDFAGSVTDIPFSTGEFTACICTEVMEHVADDECGFAELGRVIRPGGLLLISTPTPPAPFDPNHIREGYTFEELSARLERNGFDVVRHAFCFHWVMRALLVIWRWQFENLGGAKRSLMPRFVVHFAGALDRTLTIGKPWDIVVLARKRASTST